MLVIRAFITSTPVHFSPLICLDRREARVSIGSMPAFSANVSGIVSNASANFSAASCSRPSNVLAQLLILVAVKVSGAPPPATIEGFSMTSLTTIIAS